MVVGNGIVDLMRERERGGGSGVGNANVRR